MQRFVYIPVFADLANDEIGEPVIFAETRHVEAWGWLKDDNENFAELTILYGPRLEGPEIGDVVTLYDEERAVLVDADEHNTPDEAWARLAQWRLTGSI